MRGFPLLALPVLLASLVGCQDGCSCRADETSSGATEPAATEPARDMPEPSAPQREPSGEEYSKVAAAAQGDPSATVALAQECDRGLSVACVSLAAAWESGDGVRASEAEARRIYRASCRRAGEGCLDAARMHADQAGPYFERGCEAGLAEACRRWAEAMPDRAEEARTRGCRLGWWDACTEPVEGCGGTLARCVERAAAMKESRPAEARRLASIACRDETVGGCALYAELLRTDDALAAQVAYEWGCTAGDLASCRALLDGSFTLDAATRARAEERVATLTRAGVAPSE
ncbi:MAG: hypothetical protein MUE69_16430 [Myxococcota bacterium]|jgi:hypothetical protein|nr:hypothetical protein [Myxococcota bacterium]